MEIDLIPSFMAYVPFISIILLKMRMEVLDFLNEVDVNIDEIFFHQKVYIVIARHGGEVYK
jgi:hypothetical protein